MNFSDDLKTYVAILNKVSYCLFLITFLVFPISIEIWSKAIHSERAYSLFKPAFLFFGVHNLFYFWGYSLNGDYIDYSIFSLEYFVFCLAANRLYYSENIYLQTIAVLGKGLMWVGFVMGLVGIFMFIVISQKYETDEVFSFDIKDRHYETRRYSYGFVTLLYTSLTYDTYRRYKFFPIEHKMNRAWFLGPKNGYLQYDEELKVILKEEEWNHRMIFKDKDGNTFNR